MYLKRTLYVQYNFYMEKYFGITGPMHSIRNIQSMEQHTMLHKSQLPSVSDIAISFKRIILVLKSDYCKLNNSNVSSDKV